MIDSWNGNAQAENLDRLAGHSTRGDVFNIEFRFTDATACPYLAIGAIVRADLEGIRAGLPAPGWWIGTRRNRAAASERRRASTRCRRPWKRR